MVKSQILEKRAEGLLFEFGFSFVFLFCFSSFLKKHSAPDRDKLRIRMEQYDVLIQSVALWSVRDGVLHVDHR